MVQALAGIPEQCKERQNVNADINQWDKKTNQHTQAQNPDVHQAIEFGRIGKKFGDTLPKRLDAIGYANRLELLFANRADFFAIRIKRINNFGTFIRHVGFAVGAIPAGRKLGEILAFNRVGRHSQFP
jgi:hypothetical protein